MERNIRHVLETYKDKIDIINYMGGSGGEYTATLISNLSPDYPNMDFVEYSENAYNRWEFNSPLNRLFVRLSKLDMTDVETFDLDFIVKYFEEQYTEGPHKKKAILDGCYKTFEEENKRMIVRCHGLHDYILKFFDKSRIISIAPENEEWASYIICNSFIKIQLEKYRGDEREKMVRGKYNFSKDVKQIKSLSYDEYTNFIDRIEDEDLFGFVIIALLEPDKYGFESSSEILAMDPNYVNSLDFLLGLKKVQNYMIRSSLNFENFKGDNQAYYDSGDAIGIKELIYGNTVPNLFAIRDIETFKERMLEWHHKNLENIENFELETGVLMLRDYDI